MLPNPYGVWAGAEISLWWLLVIKDDDALPDRVDRPTSDPTTATLRQPQDE